MAKKRKKIIECWICDSGRVKPRIFWFLVDGIRVPSITFICMKCGQSFMDDEQMGTLRDRYKFMQNVDGKEEWEPKKRALRRLATDHKRRVRKKRADSKGYKGYVTLETPKIQSS